MDSMAFTDKAKDIADTALQRIGEYSEKAGEKAAELAEQARERAPEYLDKAVDLAEKAADVTAAGVDKPTPWLPYQSALQMANPDLDPGDPSRFRAGLFLGVIVIAFVVIGIIVNDRRDA